MEASRRSWISTALWVFPLGLCLLGVVWTIYLLKKPEAAEHRERQAYRPSPAAIDEVGLRRYVEVLAGQVGARDASRPEALERVASYIQSTLGPLNTGYPVQRFDLETSGEPATVLVAEREGASRPNDVLLVAARYDAPARSPGAHDNASGVAVLLALARAFVDAEPPLTLRFCAFAGPAGGGGEALPGETYAGRCEEQGENIIGMIDLRAIGIFADGKDAAAGPAPDPALAPYFPERRDYLAFVGREADAPWLNELARQFARFESLPTHRVILPAELSIGLSSDDAFRGAGYPAVRVTDTGRNRHADSGGVADLPVALDFGSIARVAGALEQSLRTFLR